MLSAAETVAALTTALSGLAPPGVGTGVRRLRVEDLARLHPDEEPLIARAVLKRRVEVASGRALLRTITGHPGPFLALSSRAVAMPDGTVGTLAHDDAFVIAAVSKRSRHQALGVDIEPDAVFEPEVASLVLRTEERLLSPSVAFCLKEAAYKAWSAIGGRLLEHHDVSLAIADGAFEATILPEGFSVPGRFASCAGRTIALAWLTAPQPQQP